MLLSAPKQDFTPFNTLLFFATFAMQSTFDRGNFSPGKPYSKFLEKLKAHLTSSTLPHIADALEA